MGKYFEELQKLKLEGKPSTEKKVYKIPRVSKKRAKINREYAKLTKPLWDGKQCEIKAPGCTGMAQGMQHKRGKATIARLMNVKEIIPGCNHCNGIWIEENSKEAERLGFKLPRNSKE